jgi:rhodanese-related sulfurtransferase
MTENAPTPSMEVAAVAGMHPGTGVMVLDVREPSEWAQGHIPGAVLIPMMDVPRRLKEIPADGTVIVACHSGNRSERVTLYLRAQGFQNIYNMLGGMVAWARAGYPVERPGDVGRQESDVQGGR